MGKWLSHNYNSFSCLLLIELNFKYKTTKGTVWDVEEFPPTSGPGAVPNLRGHDNNWGREGEPNSNFQPPSIQTIRLAVLVELTLDTDAGPQHVGNENRLEAGLERDG